MSKRNLFAISTLLLSAVGTQAQNTPVSQMEKLDRGVIALPANSGSGNFISWRMFGTDDEDRTTFDIIRNNTVVAKNQYKTNYKDASGTKTSKYRIVTKIDGEAVDTTEAVAAWSQTYLKVTLDRPANGEQGGEYTPNDMSVGDVDGDGQYELFVKWDPSTSKDNSQGGITDNVFIDCYRLDGTKLWRVDLGRNIRAGAHYTQFMVYDFDGDGKAEMMCKTGPGSKDGQGSYVNSAATESAIKSVSGTALYRNSDGRITGGQEWLTVFKGLTGEAIHTVYYNPNRNMTYGGAADGSVNWGVGKTDKASYGNRGERYLAAVAHLDGPDKNPSGVFCRGYYDYAFIWAVDFDGTQLHQKWLCSNKAQNSYTVTTYDATGKGTTKTYNNMKPTSGSGSGTMYQNGNHNLSVADVDGDGCDEIVWGSATCDHDGRVLFGTGFGHGDAIHLADHIPTRPGLEVFQIHEGGSYGWDLHDARTGEIIYSATGGSDNGRGIAGNFDSNINGSLFWSSNDGSPRSALTGKTYYSNGGSSNFRIYWDGDVQDELLDGSKLDNWNNGSGGTSRLVTFYNIGPGSTCNGTKNTPNLQADILGDWREEVILYSVTDAETCLGIYSSNIETAYRIPTLMHDHTYRMGVCWQNTAYNQPPHLGYFLPGAMLPRLLNEEKELTVNAGDSLEIVLRGRYLKSVPAATNYITDDGKRTYGVPDSLKRESNVTTKTTTFRGYFVNPGNYTFPIVLTGLGSEKVNDTLVIHVLPADPSGIEELPAVAENETCQPIVYDAAGRRVNVALSADLQPLTSKKGLYIIKEGKRSRKVIIR